MNKIKLAELITSCFYIGKIKYAPGTCGAFAAYILFLGSYPISSFITFYYFIELNEYNTTIFDWCYFPLSWIILTILLFFIGMYFSTIYINNIGTEDPCEIVIDEVVGQWLTNIFCFPLILSSLDPFTIILRVPFAVIVIPFLPFILFRLFDIFKPWPINWIDRNIKGGLGVMLDDIVAAIFAVVTNYIIIFFVLYGLL